MSADQTNEDFLRFWKHISWKSGDETLIVLKGHLLLEDLMREYCASRMESEKYLDEARLSFSQIAHLTRALNKYQAAEWIWSGFLKVNKLRNRLAHNLEPRDYFQIRDALIEYVKLNSADKSIYDHFSKDYEQLAISIFILHTNLSVLLRFTPRGLLDI